MKKSNNPEFKRFDFIQNEKRADIYDLQGERDPRLFHYFRISEPRMEFLKRQGARHIIESWQGHEKTSFTGLIPVGVREYYFGDLLLKTGKKQRKSLIIVRHQGERITIYLFPAFTLYPSKRLAFCRRFVSTIHNAMYA